MSSVEFATTQHIGQVYGGIVSGVYIERMITATSGAPPTVHDVRAYLEEVVTSQTTAEQRRIKSVVERQPDEWRTEVEAIVTRYYQASFEVIFTDGARLRRVALRETVTALLDPRAVDQGGALVILAESGSGKTLALNQLWCDLAKLSLDAAATDVPPPIPIMVYLRELRGGLSVEELIRAAFNAHIRQGFTLDQVDRMLHELRCILLLDGLDELPTADGIVRLRQFLRDHPAVCALVSVRTSAYHNQLEMADACVLDDLHEADVANILGTYWDGLSQPMRHLACNRTLLWKLIDAISAVIASAESGRVFQMTLSKGHLVNWLMEQRLNPAVEHGAPWPLESRMFPELLERLGDAFQSARTYSYSDRQVMEVVSIHLNSWQDTHSWQEIMQYLDGGLGILKRSSGQWRFCDRQSQAYFAAASALHDPARAAALLQNAADPWWNEALEIYLGLLDDPTEATLTLIDAHPVVAADRLAQAGRPLSAHMANALLDALKERLDYGRATDHECVANRIVGIDHPKRWKILTSAALRTRYSSVMLSIARAYIQLGPVPSEGEDAFEKPIPTNDLEVATYVLACGRSYSESTESRRRQIEDWLAKVLRSRGGNPQLRGLAAITLGLLGSDRARTILLSRLRRSQHLGKDEAWCIVDGLTQMPHPRVDEVVWQLIELNDADYYCRARAVYLLGWSINRKRAADTLLLALADEHEEVRRRAAQALGILMPPAAVEELRRRLETETSERVVDKIVQSLAQIGGPELLPLLERRLRWAERAATRRHIREAITIIRYRSYTT